MSKAFLRRLARALAFNQTVISDAKRREWQALADDSETATDGPWWVTENDLVGGWCIRTIGEPPSTGRGITIADFVREEDARLCATARNLFVPQSAYRPSAIPSAATDEIKIRPDGRLYLEPRSARYGTSGGVELTDGILERMADEAEAGYTTEQLRPRKER